MVAPGRARRSRYLLPAFGVVFVVVFVVSLGVGQYPVAVGDILRVLVGKLAGTDTALVVHQIRLPRLLADALVGAGLAVAGAAFQGLFRNPMASPDILGASAGAGFGAALALFLGAGYAVVSANAFVFGLVAVGIAYAIGARARRNPTLGLVLAGIMIASLFSAATSYVKLVSDPENVLPAITFWLMGSFANVQWSQLAWAVGPIGGGIVVLMIARWRLNLLTMGEDEARSMGVNALAMRLIVVGFATLITSACVAISGLVGWVGLVVPHLARLTVGDDNRVMIPASMLMGATFLVVVDDIARAATATEVPIGILTAFVGAPFFLYVMLGKGSRL